MLDRRKLLALTTLGLGVAVALWANPDAEPADTRADATADADAERAATRTTPGSTAARGAAPSAEVAGSTASAAPQGGYHTDRLLVQAADSAALDSLALDYGVDILTPPGRSGFASLQVPESMSAAAFRAELLADDRVQTAVPMGATRGTGYLEEQQYRAHPLQWHLPAVRAPLAGDFDVSEWVVAVLDTGVAYEDHVDDQHTYVQAPSLSGVAFVSPIDLINGDQHANDDHQHGTHITSLIASEGQYEGVAAGVSIMPVKVLDEHNAGTEIALIEGIYHAVDNGADVINMSLSFQAGYVPSQALQAAIAYAHDAGVVMVGAAGNEGQGASTWPGASRLVLSVAGGRPTLDNPITGWDGSSWELSEYTNRSGAVDITGPGGALDADHTMDGYVDGVVAETIALNDPTDIDGWFYAGSSQAAAVVTGAVVHILEAGGSHLQARPALQMGASPDGFSGDKYSDGEGGGGLHVFDSVKLVADQDDLVNPMPQFHVSVLPYLKEVSGGVQPRAKVTVVHDDGAIAADGFVYGTLWSDDGAVMLMCQWHSWDDGACDLVGPTVSDPTETAWAFTVDGVSDELKTMAKPGKVVFATDGGEVLLSAMQAQPDLDGAMLAIHWDGSVDPVLGDLAPSYSVVDMGTGIATSPMGVVFRPEAIAGYSVATTVEVDLDGTGLATSPLGIVPLQVLSFTGSGLATSPLGFQTLQLAAIDGSGLATSPLGFHPTHMFGHTLGSGLATSPLGFNGNSVLLSTAQAVGFDAANTAFGAMLDAGGVRSVDSYEGASLTLASGVVNAGWHLSDVNGASSHVGGLDGPTADALSGEPPDGNSNTSTNTSNNTSTDGDSSNSSTDNGSDATGSSSDSSGSDSSGFDTGGFDTGGAYCEVAITRARINNKGKLVVWAVTDDPSADLEVWAGGDKLMDLRWKDSKQRFQRSQTFDPNPTEVEVVASCGGIDTRSVD